VKKTIITLCLGINLFAQDTSTIKYPAGEVGKMVKLGEDIVTHTNTHPMTKDIITTNLTCMNCHLAGKDSRAGTTKNIGTFIGTSAAFPAYSSRHKRIQVLQERIDSCFLRCMSSKKSFMGTKAMSAVEAYVASLSDGEPMHMNTKGPRSHKITKLWEKNTKKFANIYQKATHENYVAGKEIYQNKCAACHGQNGEGTDSFPALWGKDKHGHWLSYGADGSMAKLKNSATWIQDNMPFQQERTLSDQEAADVALFVNAQERKSYKGYEVKDNFKKYGLNLKEIRGE